MDDGGWTYIKEGPQNRAAGVLLADMEPRSAGNLDEPEVQLIVDGQAEALRAIVARVLAAVWMACAARPVLCSRAARL
jgi:hypothetical protein